MLHLKGSVCSDAKPGPAGQGPVQYSPEQLSRCGELLSVSLTCCLQTSTLNAVEAAASNVSVACQQCS